HSLPACRHSPVRRTAFRSVRAEGVNRMNRFSNYFRPGIWLTALLVGACVAGCGSGDSNPSPTTPGAGTGMGGAGGHGPTPVNLGTAGNYAILAKSGIT